MTPENNLTALKKEVYLGISTHFWNRIECRRCGRKHFIFTFNKDTDEYGESSYFKICKCHQRILID